MVFRSCLSSHWPFVAWARWYTRYSFLPLAGNFSDYLLQQVLSRLWYLWKARNDYRFNNNKWTVKRVCHETEADIAASTLWASPPTYTNNKTMSMPHFPNPVSQLAQSTLPMPRQRYLLSSILQGYGPNNTPVVSFSDAALPPDGKIGTWKNAGQGVFLDLRATSLACSVHIQANTQVLSVLMAELNALLLAELLLCCWAIPLDWSLIVFWQSGTCSRICRKCHGSYGQWFLKSKFSKIDISLMWSKFHDLKTLKCIALLFRPKQCMLLVHQVLLVWPVLVCIIFRVVMC